jgi:hypothetical protein
VSDIDNGELGPIDYIVVEFPPATKNFSGAMATELASLVDAELIRILDLLIIDKSPDGGYEVLEFEDLGPDDALGDLRALEGKLAEVLALEDLDRIVEAIEPGATAAVLVWENTWAAPFATAARQAGGQLVASGRIPTQALVATLEAAAEGD